MANQQDTILKCKISSIITLRHFLKELTTESDSDLIPHQANILSQLTHFIDERFDITQYSPLAYVEINYMHSPHHFVIAGLLQKKIIPHEIMHVIQQGKQTQYITIKPTIIKQTIAALYKSARLLDLEAHSKCPKFNTHSLFC